MTHRSKSFLIVLAAALAGSGFSAQLWAQDTGGDVVSLPDVVAPNPDAPQDPAPDPLPDPQPPFEWTQSRTNTNTSGSVSNTHQTYTAEDGNTYIRQHALTNPAGQMTHTWQRTNDGDSYTLSREMNKTFRDGRTMEMTRTYDWDAESGTGTISRSFLGPNGQSQGYERPWTPDGDLPDLPDLPDLADLPDLPDLQPSLSPDGPTTLDTPQPTERSIGNLWGLFRSPKKPKPKSSFWARLDSFRDRGRSMAGPRRSPRSGFTLGSTSRHNISAPRYGLAKKQAGQAQVKTSRPKPPRPSKTVSRPHPVKTH